VGDRHPGQRRLEVAAPTGGWTAADRVRWGRGQRRAATPLRYWVGGFIGRRRNRAMRRALDIAGRPRRGAPRDHGAARARPPRALRDVRTRDRSLRRGASGGVESRDVLTKAGCPRSELGHGVVRVWFPRSRPLRDRPEPTTRADAEARSRSLPFRVAGQYCVAAHATLQQRLERVCHLGPFGDEADLHVQPSGGDQPHQGG